MSTLPKSPRSRGGDQRPRGRGPGRPPSRSPRRWIWAAGAALAVALAVVIGVVVGTSGGGDDGGSQAPPASVASRAPAARPPARSGTRAAAAPRPRLGSKVPGYVNGDLGNRRDYAGTITSRNVAQLRPTWSLPLDAGGPTGSYATTPVAVNGVIYSQDLTSNVKALSARTGEILWQKDYNVADWGPNGIAVVGGAVYGITTDSAFALDRRTGRQLWRRKIVTNPHQGIDMAPGVHGGMVYVSTVPGNTGEFYAGGARSGILYALNAKTGRTAWTFNTAPVARWSRAHTDINLGGGLWYPPAFDGDGGMYIGVANPGPFPGTDQYPWGSSRPGPDLYTNSVVKLDARTGRLRWYYQVTPHDVYDWDLQDSPVLATVRGRPAVIGAGKSGMVVALDRRSGRLLWKVAVGRHNGHDRDGLYAMRRQYSKLKTGVEVFPGYLGGVIAPMASDGRRLYVPIVDQGVTYDSQTQPRNSQTQTGEVVALDLATGRRVWKADLPAPAFGATSVINDVVFATSFDGNVHAYSARDGTELWRATLPARTNAGIGIDGDGIIAPAGAGQGSAITTFRLPAAAARK